MLPLLPQSFEDHVAIVRFNREQMRARIKSSRARKETKAILLEWVDGVERSVISKKYGLRHSHHVKELLKGLLDRKYGELDLLWLGYGVV